MQNAGSVAAIRLHSSPSSLTLYPRSVRRLPHGTNWGSQLYSSGPGSIALGDRTLHASHPIVINARMLTLSLLSPSLLAFLRKILVAPCLRVISRIISHLDAGRIATFFPFASYAHFVAVIHSTSLRTPPHPLVHHGTLHYPIVRRTTRML